jgi:hypothetical protein
MMRENIQDLAGNSYSSGPCLAVIIAIITYFPENMIHHRDGHFIIEEDIGGDDADDDKDAVNDDVADLNDESDVMDFIIRGARVRCPSIPSSVRPSAPPTHITHITYMSHVTY